MRCVPVVLLICLIPFSISAQQARENRGRSTLGKIFSVRGVEFSEDQKAQVERIRNEYGPKLREINGKRSEAISADQRRAWTRAMKAARHESKSRAQAHEAARKAANLTDREFAQYQSAEKEFRDLVAVIQSDLRALLTDQQKQGLQSGRNRNNGGGAQRRIAPSYPNVKYGPHERNVMDVWTADSDNPTPVLVSIHGGGFRKGKKGIDSNLLRACLESGISVVAITYRLSGEAIAPAQFHDAARAIQFIRHKAKEWNCDPHRIAATGGSAGAGLSLWLGFHDDLADPNSDDPILRQSTRLTCMAVYNGQTSYDPRVIRDLFPDTNTYQHPALSQLLGINVARLDELPPAKYRLFKEISALPHVSKDDVSVLLMYAAEMDTPVTNRGVAIHHPKFAEILKEKMDGLGLDCRIATGIRRGSDEFTRKTIEFLNEQFDAH